MDKLLVLVIGALGVWIAYHQLLTAHAKYQLDLFDRRYRVFEAVREVMIASLHGNIADETWSKFVIATVDAPFLFGEDIQTFTRQIIEHVAHIRAFENVNNEIAPRLVAERKTILANELQDRIHSRFAPYLNVANLRSPGHSILDSCRRLKRLGFDVHKKISTSLGLK